MAHGIKMGLKIAKKGVAKLIRDQAESSQITALASEGFNGGYQAALDDVTLALNGVEPDRWRRWRHEQENPS